MCEFPSLRVTVGVEAPFRHRTASISPTPSIGERNAARTGRICVGARTHRRELNTRSGDGVSPRLCASELTRQRCRVVSGSYVEFSWRTPHRGLRLPLGNRTTNWLGWTNVALTLIASGTGGSQGRTSHGARPNVRARLGRRYTPRWRGESPSAWTGRQGTTASRASGHRIDDTVKRCPILVWCADFESAVPVTRTPSAGSRTRPRGARTPSRPAQPGADVALSSPNASAIPGRTPGISGGMKERRSWPLIRSHPYCRGLVRARWPGAVGLTGQIPAVRAVVAQWCCPTNLPNLPEGLRRRVIVTTWCVSPGLRRKRSSDALREAGCVAPQVRTATGRVRPRRRIYQVIELVDAMQRRVGPTSSGAAGDQRCHRRVGARRPVRERHRHRRRPRRHVAGRHTHPYSRFLDDVQREVGEGPCLSAAWNQHVISIDDLSTDIRWPRYRDTVLRRTRCAPSSRSGCSAIRTTSPRSISLPNRHTRSTRSRSSWD